MKAEIIRGIPIQRIFNFDGQHITKVMSYLVSYLLDLFDETTVTVRRQKLEMCLWLLSACLGMFSTNPSQVIVVPAIPSPILQPTTTAATTAMTMRPGNMTMQPGQPTMQPGQPTMPPGQQTMPPGQQMMQPGQPTMQPGPPPMGTMMPASMGTMMPSMSPTMPATMPPTPGNTSMPPPTPSTSNMPMTPTSAPTAPAMPTAATTITPPPVGNPSSPPPMTSIIPTVSSAPSTGLELSPLILCTDPDVVCVINPDELITGSIPIDPRLGTTASALTAIQVPQVTGYNAPIQPIDDAVRFPRDKRDISLQRDMNIKDFLLRTAHYHTRSKRQTTCTCVAKGMCPTSNYGAGMIDIRIVTPGANQCASNQEYCCIPTTTPAPAPIACGTLQTVTNTGITPAAGQANFGEFPWQALVMTKQNDYLAGGVLIDSLNVLTVRHRIESYIVSGTAPNVKVRLGDWNAAVTTEPVAFQEYTVKKVFIHPSYQVNTLQYDIAVLRLASAVPFTPAAGAATTINRACLPASATTVYDGMKCMVAGWGKNMFGVAGLYQPILKKVEVPIVASATCQTQLQTARLGATFVLDTTSFLCAGGEANKDACTGDGGSGLVCQVNGQWAVVGLVAWGLGCAAASVPGVYVNVAALLPWIQQQVAAAA